MRKGNKKFAVFDLQLSLAWEGQWFEEEETKVRGPRSHVMGIPASVCALIC